MSNPNLPVSGFQYVIDSSTINQSANQVINAQNRIEQSTRNLTQRTESYDRAIGANHRSMRLLTSELVNLTGAGGQATSIITGLVAAAGPLDVALIAIGGGAIAAKAGIDAASQSFEAHQQTLANVTRSYDDLLRARNNALRNTGEGLITGAAGFAASAKDAYLELAGQAIGDTVGRGILLGISGQVNAQNVAGLIIDSIGKYKNPAQALESVLAAAGKKFQAQQQELATQQYVQAAANRATATSLQEQIDKMAAAGATADQLIPKFYELARAQGAVRTLPGGGISAGVPITGKEVEEAANRFIKGESFLSSRANELARNLLDAQAQYQSESSSLAQEHQDRLRQIDAQGAEARSRIARQGAQARANIERSYARQIEDINEALADARASAAENVAERIADAEANAQDRRIQIDQQLADRRVSIEENYQDRIRQINEDYGGSVLDATIRRDATALYRAKEAKARGLKDAEAQRQKELADAQKEHDKQAKELADALAKQKAEIQRDYERRIRDLEANADKQRTKADDNRREQLADQKQSEADQLADQKDAEGKARASEKKSYDERQAQIAQSFADRKTQLIKGLSEEKELTERYAKDIIRSLKGILNPAEIAALIKEFDAQLKAKIEITVTPFQAPITGPGDCPPGYHKNEDGNCVKGGAYALGGYTGEQGGVVHPHEWVIPNPATAGNDRVNAVLGAYAASREYSASPGMAGTGRNAGVAEAAALIKEFDAQLKAKIDIAVMSYAPSRGGSLRTPGVDHTEYAYGGYTGSFGGTVHPGEWVIPNPATAGNERVNAVLGAYAESRDRTVSPVISSARYGGSAAAAAGGGQVTLEVMLNGDMLDSRIVRQSANVTTQIVKRSRSR